MINGWLYDDYMMIIWWLMDDYMMIIWWLYDDYMMIKGLPGLVIADSLRHWSHGPVEIVDFPSYIAWWIFPVRYM